jgi:hypothetical protein
MAAAGMTAEDIAEALRRTRIGVKSKAMSLGLALGPRDQGPAERSRVKLKRSRKPDSVSASKRLPE